MISFDGSVYRYVCTNATLESLDSECADDQESCDYTVYNGEQPVAAKLNCECSWFHPTRRFCPMGSQNATYIKATQDFRDYLSTITKKHTDKRFTFNSYSTRKNFFYNTQYPKYVEAPPCGYDFLLSVNYIKVSFFALFALALLF